MICKQLTPCRRALAAGWIKGNFDVAVKGSFAVATAVPSDERGAIVGATMLKLHCPDAPQGKVLVAVMTTRLAASFGCNFLSLEGDALLVVLAINNPYFFLGILLIVFIILV
jgi:hypothetical protein